MHRFAPQMLTVILALASLYGATPDAAALSPTTLGALEGDFSGPIDIGDGRRLYLECRGSGSPAVILEAGFRTRADVWSDDLVKPDNSRTMVLPGVASSTRVCAYDRPGTATVLDGQLLTSRSDPVPMPRAASDVVDDLHALLAAAEIPGPYVLVEHSFGGLFARLYASTYPDGVAGLVLADAFPEGMKAQMTPEQWTAYEEIVQPVPPALADYPNLEFADLDASLAQMREAAEKSPFGSLPLIVLSRGQAMQMPPDLPDGLTAAFLESAWHVGQEELAALTPDARHMIATESEHYIQLQQPDLVIAAVREVVDAVRALAAETGAMSAGTPVA